MTQSESENNKSLTPSPIFKKQEADLPPTKKGLFSRLIEKIKNINAWLKEEGGLEAFVTSESFEKFLKLSFDHFKNYATAAGFIVIGLWFRADIVRNSYSKGFAYWLLIGMSVFVVIVGIVFLGLNFLHGLAKMKKGFSKSNLMILGAFYGVTIAVVFIYFFRHNP